MIATAPRYRTVKETASAWGVSKRWVNTCISEGRINGAVRMGAMWLIPSYAERPADKRSLQPSKTLLFSDLMAIIEATVIPWPKENPDAILDTMGENRLRLQCEGELAYLRGDFTRVKQCFQDIGDDDAAKLRACSLTIAAAISIGDYPFYKAIESYLEGIIQVGADANISALAELSLNVAYASAIAPNMMSAWLKSGDFSILPPQARPDAAYKRAKYYQGLGQYEAMLAVAQTALAFCGGEDEMSFTGIYLLVACAIACCGLRRGAEAERYLMDALDISLPYGFITPFAESAVAFSGLLEQCLERKYPEYLRAMKSQWNLTFINWLTFHNRFTKDNITTMLSLRNYEIASSVARRVPRAEIARRFHVSSGRLNNIIQEIYRTLLVSNRDELSRFIL